MKLLGVLLLSAVVTAVPTADQKTGVGVEISPDSQLFSYIRNVINNGSVLLGIPPLDPLVLENYHLYIPAGLINLDLDLKNARMTGIGGFVVHTSNFVPSQLSFDLEISVPSVEVVAEHYDLVGDLFTAIPLYGKGQARFLVEGFRFRGKLLLKQSDDGKSILIDRIINAGYEIPSFKSELTGVIGGGDIDNVVNAIIEEVIVDYTNRFQGAIAALWSAVLPAVANPILQHLDSWKYISIFV